MSADYRSNNSSDNVSDLQAMLSELDNITAVEIKKNEAERDEQLIADAITEMAELKNVRSSFTQAEIGERFELIQSQLSEEREKKRRRLRRSIAAVCAACLMLVVTACAVPTVRNWLIEISKLPAGTSIRVNGITYTNHGVRIVYKNIEELLTAEKLDIYYPTALPEGLYITEIEILTINGADTVFSYFNYPDFSYQVQLNFTADMSEYEIHTDNIAVDGVPLKVFENGDRWISFGNLGPHFYTIQAKNYEDVILITESLTKIATDQE